MKRKMKILSLLAALVLGQLLFVGPAGAADEEQSVQSVRHYFKSLTTRRCLLGGQITSHGTGWVGTWPCEASYWLVWEWSGKYSTEFVAPVRGVAQGACLDSNDRGDVYVRRCDIPFNPNQHWWVYIPGSGGYPAIKNFGTGLCLTEPPQGGEVYTTYCDDDVRRQRWYHSTLPMA